MTYRIVTLPTTLNILQRHSPIVSFFKWDFSYARVLNANGISIASAVF